MTSTSAELSRFAEDPMTFVPPDPGQERIEDERFVVTFLEGSHDWSSSIERLRLEDDAIEPTVAHLRSLVAERGRRASTWKVGRSATPPGVAERLIELGLRRRDLSDVLVLERAPQQGSPPWAEVRMVTTMQDHRAAIEIAIAGFDEAARDAEEERARAEASFRSERGGGHSTRVLALDDGRPVATGRAWFSPLGVYLGGGATLPSDRGRGAMTALLAAAWEEAVRRGTPTLVTHGGAMSSPILRRLGFHKVGEVAHLVDRTDDGKGGSP